MNTRNYTSIDQSKRLLSLGLKAESADMCYLPTHIGGEHHWIASLSSYSECTKMTDVSIDYCIPCWSVGALLEVMPSDIHYKGVDDPYHPILTKQYTGNGDYEMAIGYQNSPGYGYINVWITAFSKKTLIDTIYDAVVWLLENNYIK